MKAASQDDRRCSPAPCCSAPAARRGSSSPRPARTTTARCCSATTAPAATRLAVVGAEGSATSISNRVKTNGPNFNIRKENVEQVLYAIRNGGFSGDDHAREHRRRRKRAGGRGVPRQVLRAQSRKGARPPTSAVDQIARGLSLPSATHRARGRAAATRCSTSGSIREDPDGCARGGCCARGVDLAAIRRGPDRFGLPRSAVARLLTDWSAESLRGASPERRGLKRCARGQGRAGEAATRVSASARCSSDERAASRRSSRRLAEVEQRAAGRARSRAAQPARPDRRRRPRGRARARGRRGARARLPAARPPRAGGRADRHGPRRQPLRLALRLPERRPRDARAGARALGAREAARGWASSR